MRQQFKDMVLEDQQLRELAVAARVNAAGMITEARLLLDARKIARAHALAVLGLEEAGKIELCLGALFGLRSSEEVLASWDSHTDKLEQSHYLALLFVESYPITSEVVKRLGHAVHADAVQKLRGLYVDPTVDGIATPEEISEQQAMEIVTLAEAILEVLEALDLVGALERFRSPDADLGRC